MRLSIKVALSLALFGSAAGLRADDSPAAPAPARTRPEMKKRIEGLKQREARLPLPSLSAEDIAAGVRSVNNGRLRSLYLPESWLASRSSTGGSGSGRGAGGSTGAGNNRGGGSSSLGQMAAAPDFGFKTRLFWIVSRTNDCQYCLGHQELKLRRAGMTEDQIASLDSRWSEFPAAEQAAMAFTRKLTLTPHLVTPADVAALKAHYSDEQIVDVLQTICGNNSTNRWTASTGIPQDRSFGGDEPSQLDTPTSEAFTSVETKVAPIDYVPRPAWESRSEAEAAMAACRGRTPTVKLPTADAGQAAIAADTPGVLPPNWVRASAYSAPSALRLWKHRQALARDGRLDANLKALIGWVCAREDRAWYAAAHARARLNAMGVADDRLFAVGGDEASFSPKEKAVFAFVHKLTSAPHTVVDADVAGLRKEFSDHEVAEIIFLTCDANSFDRFTEALRLPLEEEVVAVGSAR